MPVKGNQQTLHRKVTAAFDAADRSVCTSAVKDCCETVERNGGRRERRTYTVLGSSGLCQWGADSKVWPDLCRVARVQAERNGPRGRQHSVRYYILSRPRTRRP